MVVFLQKWLYSSISCCIRESGFILAKWLFSGKRGFILPKWLQLGKRSCIRANMDVFRQSCRFRIKVVIFEQSGCIRHGVCNPVIIFVFG